MLQSTASLANSEDGCERFQPKTVKFPCKTSHETTSEEQNVKRAQLAL
jgi:hypothetical protein